jgi:hypothetical protein
LKFRSFAITVMVLSLFVTVVPTAALANSDLLKTNDSLQNVIPFSIPVPDGSFTLIGEATDNNHFFKGQTAIIIGGTVKIALDGLASRYGIKGYAVGGTTSMIGSTIAYLVNNLSPDVYYKHRIGISWNSTYNFYEYINASVRYTDSSYTSILSVEYYNTGYAVPSDVLAKYGLRNP